MDTNLFLTSLKQTQLKQIIMKDKYFLYYHCIRNTIFQPSYQCISYDDPFDIPTSNTGIDSVIVPVHRWTPTWYHSYYLTKQIQNLFQIQILNEPR
jgi:hypothetical protein